MKYCTECGTELIRVPKPAHKLTFYGHFCDLKLGNKFNPETGLRQFGIQVRCPNKKWYNDHTCYTDEDSLHDSDLPELLSL